MTGRYVVTRSLVLALTAAMLAPALVGPSGAPHASSTDPTRHRSSAVTGPDRGLVTEGLPGLWSWTTRTVHLGRDGAVAWGLGALAFSVAAATCCLLLAVARDRGLPLAVRVSQPTRGPPDA